MTAYMKNRRPVVPADSFSAPSYCWRCCRVTPTVEVVNCFFCEFDKRGKVPLEDVE